MAKTRKVGWEDTSITGGRGGGPDKERRYRGKKGETHVIRIMTDCEEFRQHVVDDVLDPDEHGEPRAFYMNCSKEWSDEDEDWTGECAACDEHDYDLNGKFMAGILLVGIYKGRSKKVQRIDPENSVHWWDFGADKYRALSDVALELQRGKKARPLNKCELVVKCEDDTFQKLNINISQAETLTTKEHVEAWKEEGEKLIEEATRAPTSAEMKRRLKKKKSKRRHDDDDSDDEEDERPKRKKARKVKKKREPEPDDSDEEEIEDEGTGDEDLDDLLAEL